MDLLPTREIPTRRVGLLEPNPKSGGEAEKGRHIGIYVVNLRASESNG